MNDPAPEPRFICNPILDLPLRDTAGGVSTNGSRGTTQPLDGPPAGLVARVWPADTNCFSPGEVWVAAAVPITIWSGAQVITSWYDRWARPRCIATSAMSALRYTTTPINVSDIEANQVIIWNPVGSFEPVPAPPPPPPPPPFLGNRLLPRAGGFATGLVPTTVGGTVTATVDFTRTTVANLATFQFQYSASSNSWFSVGSSGSLNTSAAICIDRARVTYTATGNSGGGFDSTISSIVTLGYPSGGQFSLVNSFEVITSSPGTFTSSDYLLRSQYSPSALSGVTIDGTVTNNEYVFDNTLWCAPFAAPLTVVGFGAGANFGSVFFNDGDQATVTIEWFSVSVTAVHPLNTTPSVAVPYLGYAAEASAYPGIEVYNA